MAINVTVITFIKSAPSSNPGSLSHQIVVVLGYADGDDVGLEGHRLVESEQSQVVLEGLGVELGVAGHDLHLPVNVLVRFGFAVQVVFAHAKLKVVRADTICKQLYIKSKNI